MMKIFYLIFLGIALSANALEYSPPRAAMLALQEKGISPQDGANFGSLMLAKIDLCFGGFSQIGDSTYRCNGLEEPNFYGSATLISVGQKYLYYVTNAHVIGNEPLLWDRLVLRSKLPPCQESAAPCRPKVLAFNPGKDLALIGVPIAQIATLNPNISMILNSLMPPKDRQLPDSFSAWAGIVGYRNAVAGGTGKSFPIQLKNFSPEDEVRIHALRDFSADQSEFESYAKNLVQKMKPIPFWKSEDCPPVFLKNCLRMRMRSWGYSGGFVIRKFNAGHEVMGIVSSYTPLSPDTYIIPMGEIFMAFDPIMRSVEAMNASLNFEMQPYVQLRSDDGRAMWISPDQIFLNYQAYKQPTPFQVGGGHNMGGGGHNMGGGGKGSALVPGLDRILSYRTGVGGTRDLQDLWRGRSSPLAPGQINPQKTSNIPFGVQRIDLEGAVENPNMDQDQRIRVLKIENPWNVSFNGKTFLLQNKQRDSESAPAEGISFQPSPELTINSPGFSRFSGACQWTQGLTNSARVILPPPNTPKANLICDLMWINSEPEKRSQVLIYVRSAQEPNIIELTVAFELPPFSASRHSNE